MIKTKLKRRSHPNSPQQLLFELDMRCEEKRWQKLKGIERQLRKVTKTALTTLNLTSPPLFRISLLLTHDRGIRKLNLDYRGFDQATNVLSFPQFTPLQLSREIRSKVKKHKVLELGDIALAYQYIVAESKRDHKILINHMTHLLIHGIFHLFGYDHIHERDAIKMELLEIKAMKKLGLSDPYKDLTSEKRARRQPK